MKITVYSKQTEGFYGIYIFPHLTILIYFCFVINIEELNLLNKFQL